MGTAENLRRRRLRFRRRREERAPGAAMSMMGHLGELRSRLIKSLLAFVLISIVAFMFFNQITEFLLQPLCDVPRELLGQQGCRLATFSALENFTVRLKVTAMVGIIFASPVWLYQLWAFVTPALHDKEKRYALPFVFTAITLFAGGSTVAYLLLPKGLEVLIGLGGENFEPIFRANDYLGFVGLMLLGFGVTFLLPLLLFFLGLAGVVSVATLRKRRKHAFVGILLLAAVVTPSQDPYTMLALGLPLYVLYEATILLLSRVEKRRAKRGSV